MHEDRRRAAVTVHPRHTVARPRARGAQQASVRPQIGARVLAPQPEPQRGVAEHPGQDLLEAPGRGVGADLEDHVAHGRPAQPDPQQAGDEGERHGDLAQVGQQRHHLTAARQQTGHQDVEDLPADEGRGDRHRDPGGQQRPAPRRAARPPAADQCDERDDGEPGAHPPVAQVDRVEQIRVVHDEQRVRPAVGAREVRGPAVDARVVGESPHQAAHRHQRVPAHHDPPRQGRGEPAVGVGEEEVGQHGEVQRLAPRPEREEHRHGGALQIAQEPADALGHHQPPRAVGRAPPPGHQPGAHVDPPRRHVPQHGRPRRAGPVEGPAARDPGRERHRARDHRAGRRTAAATQGSPHPRSPAARCPGG